MKEGDTVRSRLFKGPVMRVVEVAEGDPSIDETTTVLCRFENGSVDWFRQDELKYEGLEEMAPIENDGIKIEKNIPIPVRGKWMELLSAMDIGDSFLIPLVSDDTKHEAALIRSNIFGASRGVKIKSRVIDNGLRVWRIE